jgi:hypothetical protein
MLKSRSACDLIESPEAANKTNPQYEDVPWQETSMTEYTAHTIWLFVP